MILTFPKETHPHENRIAILPQFVKKLISLGAQVEIESGLGTHLHISDAEFSVLGANIVKDRKTLLQKADAVLKIRKPESEDLHSMRESAVCISYLDPFNNPELLAQMNQKKISAISMEMIPRTTLAQKMDALSSQASLAGYAAVVMAAERSHKIFPMMMTPAGTITPSKVFVIGAGVAGLQAIATAKRLGAQVFAFDTRPVVEEQVQSLGARFVKIDLGETGQTKDGYARELTPEQLQKQREIMAKSCANADVVITTAQIFGRKAPVIVTKEMVAQMKPGSIIVDLAVESGGNVEGAEANKTVEKDGVQIIGLVNLPGKVALHASQMYAANISNLVEEFWNKEKNILDMEKNNDILRACLITKGGTTVNANIRR